MANWPGPVSAVWGDPGDATSPWRLVLRCRWGEGPPLVVVGMNPSTADEAEPDQTCQRWLSMARRWGYNALTVVNLYPLRATSPKDMQRGVFAIEGHEPRNVGRYPGLGQVFTDYCTAITAALDEGDFILACWGGVEGGESLLQNYYAPSKPLAYLHRTPAGRPIHPLARIDGVAVSKLRPRDWTTGELVRLPIDEVDELSEGYGAFPGGDPRTFTPDLEVCTPEEVRAHANACRAADEAEARGEATNLPGSHYFEETAEGVRHVAHEPFGVGTYQIKP